MTQETKTVRVTRTSTIERIEVIELNITRPTGEYKSHGRIAEQLVEAMVLAGQPIAWKVVSEEIKTYPAPDIEAEDGPIEVAPPPPPFPTPSQELVGENA